MDEEKSALFFLGIDDITQSYLSSIAKWNKFLAVTGILMSVLCIAGIIIGSGFIVAQTGAPDAYKSAEAFGIIIFYSIFFALYLIPCFFRLSFSNKMLRAITNNDQQLLNESLGHLKTYSKYWGVLTIVMLGLSVLTIGLVIISLAVSGIK